MSELLPLLQAEVRMLVDDLNDALRLLRTPATAGAGLARWTRRTQALVGAMSVLGRERCSRLVQRLHELGARGDAETLLQPAIAEALRWLSDFANWPAAGASADWSAHDLQLDGLIAALAETNKTNDALAQAEAAANPLLPLFRYEAEEQCARMGQWLLQLEQEPTRLELIVPVMRAAHSIKGAARAVGLEPAVELAHRLEDQLSAAQMAGDAVAEQVTEFALTSVDLLRELSAKGESAGWRERRDRLLAAGARVAPRAVPAEAGGKALNLAPATSYASSDDSDPVLRIRASVVGRLIALAGSSVVGSRRLGAFGERQQRLRRQVIQLGRTVDDLHQRLGAPAAGTAAGLQLAELRKAVGLTRQQTQTWIDDFAEYARTAIDLNERIYQAASMTRLRPFRDLVICYPRMLRDLARQLGKRVRLTIVGEALEVDRDVLEKLDAPLTHLLRNALDHGLEPPALRRVAGKPDEGRVQIFASHRAGMLAIEVSDDGAGIDVEAVRRRIVELGRLTAEAASALSAHALCQHLFTPGFSTRDDVTEISGRGVGLDVVREGVERLGGAIRISTESRKGTSFHLQVPISRAVTGALAVRVAGEVYAFPSLRIERVLRAERSQIVSAEGLQYLPVDGRNVGLIPLAETLDLGATQGHPERLDLVVVAHQGRWAGLIVDDSISVRELERQLLAGRGYSVDVAVDGMDAWTRVREETFDLLVTDVDMPRMDGIELTRSIKQDPRLRALPVIIVSYRDRPEDRRRGLDARADRYLTKTDFHGDGFVDVVHQLIGGAEDRA